MNFTSIFIIYLYKNKFNYFKDFTINKLDIDEEKNIILNWIQNLNNKKLNYINTRIENIRIIKDIKMIKNNQKKEKLLITILSLFFCYFLVPQMPEDL